ncbi:MAG: hypothetical protein AB7T07_11195 [Steroidobacteraceae bacterium]
MKKLLAAVFLGLVLGAVLGAMTSRHFMRQRQHGLAVMWLLQSHLLSWQEAVKNNDCVAAEQAGGRLHVLAKELALAFPLADTQDVIFHSYIEKVNQVAQPVTVAGQCDYDAARLKQMQEACDDCHRDYR